MADIAVPEQSVTCISETGESIKITSLSDNFLLTNFNPSGTSVEIYTTQAYAQDGRKSYGSRLEVKELPIEFWIQGQDMEEKYQLIKEVNRVFRPKRRVKLIYEYPLGKREIEVEVEKAPYYPNASGNKRIQLCLVQLIAQKPIWYDLEMIEIHLTRVVPLFEFPFVLEEKPTLEFGDRELNNVIINDGDIEAECLIDIYGPTLNPTIRNLTTGDFIRLNRNIEAGQHVQINTASGDLYVELVEVNGERTNVMHWLAPGSRLSTRLSVGVNIIDYISDDTSNRASVVFSYRKQYVNI